MSEPILNVSNIKKHYKNTKAVDGISLQLNKGECLALLGPNGAGKTTTCEMMEGLITPDSGEVRIGGMTYDKNRADIQQLIGVQLQETTLYKRYTVLETLQLFSSFYKSAQDPHKVVDSLGLAEKKNEKLMNLSGGQKQRVYLGCALINNPELLFLDEPTTGLDPNSRRMVWDSVEQIKKQNKSIILTTHYMEEAERLADRVAIIDKGLIIATGTPKELINQYCKEGVISIAFDLSKPLEEVKKIICEQLSWFNEAVIKEQGFEVSSENLTNHLQELIRLADQLKIKITSISTRQGTLEDVFIHFTGRSFSNDQ